MQIILKQENKAYGKHCIMARNNILHFTIHVIKTFNIQTQDQNNNWPS